MNLADSIGFNKQPIDRDFLQMTLWYLIAVSAALAFILVCQLRESSVAPDSLTKVTFDTISFLSISALGIFFGYHYSKRYFLNERLNALEHANKVRRKLRQLDIPIFSSCDLFEVLKHGQEELFNEIKQVTIALLFPSDHTKRAAVEKMFAAIHHSYSTGQRSIENHENITISRGEKNMTFESSYYNKVITGTYPPANKRLTWLARKPITFFNT